MGMITNDWMDAIKGEFRQPYYKELYEFVKQEYSTHIIYPPTVNIVLRATTLIRRAICAKFTMQS